VYGGCRKEMKLIGKCERDHLANIDADGRILLK
jgi:hypothetical protein